MAVIDFGGVVEEVITRDLRPKVAAKEILAATKGVGGRGAN